MTTLIIIRGNSGSGKTSVARSLQQRFGDNTMVISQDMIRRDILKVKDGPETLAIPLMKELLDYGMKNCDIVILEGILFSNWYQPLFEYVALRFDSIFAYYYDIPFEETLKRHQTKPNCKDFGVESMSRWWNERDFMEIIHEKILTEELSLNEAVDLIYEQVCYRAK